jgi:hypothetical protein
MSDDRGMSGHSLAFSTGTRVDSAAKHIMACKIDSQLMKAYAGEKDVNLQGLDHAKLDFLTEKDDLVMNTCQKMFRAGEGAMHAYPPVISHMGKVKDHLRFFMQWLYSLRGPSLWLVIGQMNLHPGSARTKVIDLYDNFKDPNLTTMLQATVQAEIDKLRAEDANDPIVSLFEMELRETAFLQIQGYALGRAFASSISGDTVFSVLIGGCATVLNGHFPMQTGQLVQWYFGFESGMFHAHTEQVVVGAAVSQVGSRKQNLAPPAAAVGRLTAAMKRRRLEEPKRLEGNFFFPKAFVPDPDGTYHIPDRMRIFAKCINGGHAFEPVDIMIMTQSL